MEEVAEVSEPSCPPGRAPEVQPARETRRTETKAAAPKRHRNFTITPFFRFASAFNMSVWIFPVFFGNFQHFYLMIIKEKYRIVNVFAENKGKTEENPFHKRRMTKPEKSGIMNPAPRVRRPSGRRLRK